MNRTWMPALLVLTSACTDDAETAAGGWIELSTDSMQLVAHEPAPVREILYAVNSDEVERHIELLGRLPRPRSSRPRSARALSTTRSWSRGPWLCPCGS
jgi:hypothetical protein